MHHKLVMKLTSLVKVSSENFYMSWFGFLCFYYVLVTRLWKVVTYKDPIFERWLSRYVIRKIRDDGL